MTEISLGEQLKYFDRHAERAFARCLRELKARKTEILALARRRMTASYPIYKDRSWFLSHAELLGAELEEYADAVNYRLMRMRQGWLT